MRTTLLYVLVAIGTTLASSFQRIENVESNRTKRILLDSGQQALIKDGFDAAAHFFDKMDKLDFHGVTGTVIGTVSSFLGAIGPFVGLVLNLFGGPSAESQLLKRMFTQIENRFDQVDVQFASLRREVAFVTTQIHFTDLESNINAVQSELNMLSRVTNHAGYTYESREYIHTFDRTYESSGIKLYNAIIHGGLTTGGLFHEFMTHSANDRRSTQRFMIGTLNLLMRAAALEMAYSKLKHDPNIDMKRRLWLSHFSQVELKMMMIDKQIQSNAYNQVISDINTFAALHPKGSLSNSDFASQLYSKLTSKFYWRDWFVLVSYPYDSRKFATHACHYSQHDNHGRTINVASVDKLRKQHTDGTGGLWHLHLYTQQKCRPMCGHSPYRYHCSDASAAFNQLHESARNCHDYAASGVVCLTSTDIQIQAAPGRLKAYSPHHTNKAFLFG